MSSALGLGGYASSDDEDGTVAPVAKASQAVANTTIGEALPEAVKLNATSHAIEEPETLPSTTPAPAPEPSIVPGPALGPLAGPAAGPAPMPDQAPQGPSDAQDGTAPPSPYTANRMLIRDLTMPPVPNFEIPPSPPGSPPPTTTTKFARFLELKTKGSHFNDRLNHSSALRNPALLAKLIDFAGIGHDHQYATPWPKEHAITTKFPEWAYADKLVAAHAKIANKREQERAKVQREAIDFVPPKQEPSASGSGRVERRAEGRKSRFDERRRSRSPR